MGIMEFERRQFLEKVQPEDGRRKPSKIVLETVARELKFLKKHKRDTIKVLKLIDLRERYVREAEYLVQTGDLMDESFGPRGRSALSKNLARLTSMIRHTTMEIVELIDQKWRVSLICCA